MKLELSPSDEQMHNPHWTAHTVHGHGLDFGEDTRVTFRQSDDPRINHQIYVSRHDPNSPPPHPAFPNNQRREELGHMSYHSQTGRVEGIHVPQRWQRKGIATAIWNIAKGLHEQHGMTEPQHSEVQTDEGKGWAANPKLAEIQLIRPSTVWDHLRPDLKPHSLDHLRQQIDTYGYQPDWDHVDGPIKVDFSGETPRIGNGNHRLHVLKERGMDDPVPMQVSSAKIAMPWQQRRPGQTAEYMQAKHVRDAGFAGFIGNGEEPDSDEPDDVDEHLHHFAIYHRNEGRDRQPQQVDLRDGVYATQSHVSQRRIDELSGERTRDGDEHPMFVTHEGRLHVTEGHHRVARALQRGDAHSTGWHYDLDQHPVVEGCADCRWYADMHHEGSRVTRNFTGRVPEQLPLHPDLEHGMEPGGPAYGVTKGNPQLPLYRGLQVPVHQDALEHLGESHEHDQAIAHHLMDRIDTRHSDRGHRTQLGIHWSHDAEFTKDLANNAHVSDWGGHGDDAHPVMVEADHPGHEHVIDFDDPMKEQGGGRPDKPSKDWHLTQDTIGPHTMLQSGMLPEVPIRPGAPMHVRALHVMRPDGEFHRIPVGFRTTAAGTWDKSGDWPVWVQPHEELVKDALHDWLGHPGDMHREIGAASRGEPLPEGTNGTHRITRARAEALSQEIQGGKPNRRTLYRGSDQEIGGLHPHVPTSWSEDRKVAEVWARKSGGQVHELPPGAGRGLRLADHIRDPERQWILVASAEHKTAVQTPPEGLSFTHDEFETGGSKYPTRIHLRAHTPDDGQVGALIYHPPKRRNGKILVHNLHVESDQRRQGIGSALMDEMQRRHPDASIDHGDRTWDGEDWWAGYTDGKKVTRGRTAAISDYHLDDEARVSVAEHAMERGGHGTETFEVPDHGRQAMQEGREYDWDDDRKHPAAQYLHEALIAAGHPEERARRIRVYPDSWNLRDGGFANTDGHNYVGTRPTVNKLTLLHEGAHILTGTAEGEGHGQAFQQAAHDLYHRHLGPEAAKTFRNILEPSGSAKLAAQDKTEPDLIHRGMIAHGQWHEDTVSADWDPASARRLGNGTAVASDVLRHIEPQGHMFWHHPDGGSVEDNLEDAKAYAYSDASDHPHHWTEDYPKDKRAVGDMGVVLEAKRPHGWHPDDNLEGGKSYDRDTYQQMGGDLMGHSHLPRGQHVELTGIHYTDKDGEWHRMDAGGLHVTAVSGASQGKDFDDLAPHEQAAAATYHEQMQDEDPREGETPHHFSYEIREEPVEHVKNKVMEGDYGEDHRNFDEFHQSYVENHPVPQYSSHNRWPVIVNDSNHNYIDDGFHRFHSYVRDGATHIPTMRMWWQGHHKQASATTDALDEVGRSEHPNVAHYQSGGMGHLDGDETRSVVGFMPVHVIKRYREHGGDWNGAHSAEVREKLGRDIDEGKGFHTPLMIEHNPDIGWGYLGEGNHRLAVAEEKGLKTVPVRVVRSYGSVASKKEQGIGAPMRANTVFDPHSPSYTPSDIHPYHFLQGESVHTAGAAGSGPIDWHNEPDEHFEFENLGPGNEPRSQLMGIRHKDVGRIGAVDYQPMARHVRIWHIDSHEPHSGAATRLMDELTKRYPTHKFDPLNLTDSGQKFWDRYTDSRPGFKSLGAVGLPYPFHKEAAAEDYEYRHAQPESKTHHWVTAHDPNTGERVGDMTWHAQGPSHHVTWISVYDEENRRKGIATGMWNKARQVDPKVIHNPDIEEGRTNAGHAWAQTTAAAEVTHLHGGWSDNPDLSLCGKGVAWGDKPKITHDPDEVTCSSCQRRAENWQRDRYWHVTDDPHFTPSSEARPVSRGGYSVSTHPILHATRWPRYWHGIAGGDMGEAYANKRGWAAELDVTGHPPVHEPLASNEVALDPNKVRVKKVIPIKQAMRESEESPRNDKTSVRFTPQLRVFAPTCGLDHRLFDGDKLKPDVRRYVMRSITAMWVGKYRNWSEWARVYFAGSEASEWTSPTLEGNDDFDVLVGVDYRKFRQANPAYRRAGNQAITDEMNAGFRSFNGPVTLTIDGAQYGPFDRTTFVNVDSYDITKIRPYAAYDVGADRWVVKPPHLPHWSLSDLPSPVVKTLRAADAYAHSVLKLPEPQRTQQGAALFDSWHSDRSRAFGPNGQGWYDIANLREKWLDQEGTWAELLACKKRYNAGEGIVSDWDNTPPYYLVPDNPPLPDKPYESFAKFRAAQRKQPTRRTATTVAEPETNASGEEPHEQHEFQPIYRHELSTPDARRSKPVTHEEFQEHARRGKALFEELARNGGGDDGLEQNWHKLVNHAYKRTREDWGGLTIHTGTGHIVHPDAWGYALTTRAPGSPEVSVRHDAGPEEFGHAMARARQVHSSMLQHAGAHLGVFHDNDKGTVDFDPVTVVHKISHVEDLGAYTRATGGAYHFASGDGYWPPHVHQDHQASLRRRALQEPDEKGPLPFSPGRTFYRLHDTARRFSPGDASSVPFSHGEPSRIQGYSSFDNPHDLGRYLWDMEWVKGGAGGSKARVDPELGQGENKRLRVVQFSGQHVGFGLDGEKLAVPDSRRDRQEFHVQHFFDRLAQTPHPDVPTHWHRDDDNTLNRGWHQGNGAGHPSNLPHHSDCSGGTCGGKPTYDDLVHPDLPAAHNLDRQPEPYARRR